MNIASNQFPNRFLIIPNIEEFFGEVRNNENCLEIVASSKYGDIAEFHLTRLGAIGLHFLDDGPLRSFIQHRMTGFGSVPEDVISSQAQIEELQGKRVAFANFLFGALFGSLCAQRHQALEGAKNANMADILGFSISGNVLAIEKSPRTDDLILPKLKLVTEKPNYVQVTSSKHLSEAINFVNYLERLAADFEYADLQLCVAMNYQAAILHSEQHAAASFAINFSVAEALVHEIFLAYGLIDGREAREFSARKHTCEKLSSNRFKRMKLADRILLLKAGALLGNYLYERFEHARILRNQLMHNAAAVTVRQSGELQTVVRDLWSILIEHPFELNAAHSMRM